MSSTTIQVGIFIFITALIAFLTYIKCRAAIQSTNRSTEAENREVFLAGSGLSWLFVAGSITLTNLSTDQLVGCLLYTSPSPRDKRQSRMPSSA